MAKTVYLYTKKNKEWLASSAMPVGASSVVRLESKNNLNWSAKRGAGIVYTDLHVIFGDSKPRGSSNDEASLAAVANPRIKTFRVNGTFVEYVAKTATGIDGSTNTGRVGQEYEYSRLAALAKPDEDIYILKMGVPSASASTVKTGEFIGNLTNVGGTIVKKTGGSPSPLIGDGLLGSGIADGTYVQSLHATSDWFYINKSSGVLSDRTISRFNYYLSYDPIRGYYAIHASNSIQARIAAAIAVMEGLGLNVSLKINVDLGTNDAADATATAGYLASYQRLIADLRARFAGYPIRFVLSRPDVGINVASIRTDLNTLKTSATDVFLCDTDGLPKNGGSDQTHWTIAGTIAAGANMYAVASGSSPGV